MVPSHGMRRGILRLAFLLAATALVFCQDPDSKNKPAPLRPTDPRIFRSTTRREAAKADMRRGQWDLPAPPARGRGVSIKPEQIAFYLNAAREQAAELERVSARLEELWRSREAQGTPAPALRPELKRLLSSLRRSSRGLRANLYLKQLDSVRRRAKGKLQPIRAGSSDALLLELAQTVQTLRGRLARLGANGGRTVSVRDFRQPTFKALADRVEKLGKKLRKRLSG